MQDCSECGLSCTLQLCIMKCITLCLTVLTSTTWSSVTVHQVLIHHHMLSCQMPFYSASFSNKTKKKSKKKKKDYWQKDSSFVAILATSVSDIVGQYNKIGVITFRTALLSKKTKFGYNIKKMILAYCLGF